MLSGSLAAPNIRGDFPFSNVTLRKITPLSSFHVIHKNVYISNHIISLLILISLCKQCKSYLLFPSLVTPFFTCLSCSVCNRNFPAPNILFCAQCALFLFGNHAPAHSQRQTSRADGVPNLTLSRENAALRSHRVPFIRTPPME